MSDSLPFAVRVAAGTVAGSVDFLRRLPEELPSMSVTAAGHAMRASMRLRQEVTALAARGDEFLAPLFDRPEEQPSWAHFDEDDEGSEGDGDDGYDGTAGDDAAPAEASTTETGSTTGASSTAGASSTTGASSTVDDVMPGYDDLRLAQVRGRMIRLTSAQIRALLDHEESHQARPGVITMLRNRLTTLAHQTGSTR